MEKQKQTLIDILIVFIIPVAMVILYHFFLKPDVVDEFLASESVLSGVATPGDVTNLGSKSKEILNQLDSIKFDVAFLSDPVFLSLQDFTPPYISTSTGREYPFSMPPEVLKKLNKPKAFDVTVSGAGPAGVSSSAKSTSKTSTPVTR